jgi:triphosphoribosyl-dephospho-CoA synthase
MELSIGECAQLACVLEATACKPGNVTRRHDFADMTYLDFVLSAAAIAPVLERTADVGVGMTVLEGVRATRRWVRVNTNLGILLLLAPLAVCRDRRIDEVLDRLTVADSRAVYQAIRLANPGGLGESPQQDVRGEPSLPLRQIMSLAAQRDLVARQYANGFREVYEIGVPALATGPLEPAIVRCHLRLLAACVDTHIERKCGRETACEASARAREALDGGADALAAFDAWLRADGHRRNPGSTADLVAAALFVALREGAIATPLDFFESEPIR